MKRRLTMRKIKYYLKALRWLWKNRTWENTRQKWKALAKYMKEAPQ